MPIPPSQRRSALRVLAVCPAYWPCVGGAERLLGSILENLVLRGHEATVLTMDVAHIPDLFRPSGAGLPAQDKHAGVRIARVPPGGGAAGQAVRRTCRFLVRRGLARSVPGGWADELASRPSPVGLLSGIRRARCDVVITSNWWSSICPVATAVATRRALPVVAMPLLHQTQPWSGRTVVRRMIPRCARTVALTPSEAEVHRRFGAVGTDVIGCSVPDGWGRDADGARMRARLGLGERPVVGFVGRQDEGKGAPTLVRAMQLVWRRRPEALLLLAGPRSHRDPATAAALAALGPEERGRVVEVSDFPDADAPDVFAACDLLAQPSAEESFGIVLTEAWMVGRPVIGASIPATRDLVSDGEDGLIVPPSDPARLAEAVDALLACPPTRARMGAAGRAKVISRYTVKAMTDAWESMLVDVVGGKRAKGLEPSTFSLGS